MQGYALLILSLETLEWGCLAYSLDRERLELLGERLRELQAIPCRVVECSMEDGEGVMVATGGPFRPTDLFPDDGIE